MNEVKLDTYYGYLLTVEPYSYKDGITLEYLTKVLNTIKEQIPYAIFYHTPHVEIGKSNKLLHIHTACLLPIAYRFKNLVDYIDSVFGVRSHFQKMNYKKAIDYTTKLQQKVHPCELEQEALTYYIQHRYSF